MAVEIDDALKAEIIRQINGLNDKFPSFRFIPSENWHLTLHFFGSIPVEKIRNMRPQLRERFARVPKFSFFLNSFGVFPSPAHPEILWIGLGGDLHALEYLQRSLAEWLLHMDFQIEHRSFHPHITIARAREKINRFPFHVLDQSLGAWRGKITQETKQVILFQSRLFPDGARHIPIDYFDLGDTNGLPKEIK